MQEHLFEEFLAAVCDAIAAPLDDYTRRFVRDMVDRSESDARTHGSCLQSVWVVCTLAGRHTARCEFAFESVASWVLLRVELPPEVCPPVEAAMLRAQRCRAEPGAAADGPRL